MNPNSDGVLTVPVNLPTRNFNNTVEASGSGDDVTNVRNCSHCEKQITHPQHIVTVTFRGVAYRCCSIFCGELLVTRIAKDVRNVQTQFNFP